MDYMNLDLGRVVHRCYSSRPQQIHPQMNALMKW